MSLQEILSKVKTLRSSKIPSQARQVALLDGVEEMLHAEKQDLNATAYFAALLALLDREDAAETATELLAYVVPHVPKALLASKLDAVISRLLPMLLKEDDGTSLVRASIGVLEALLSSIDGSAWQVPLSQLGALRTLSGVLALAQDSRPKIRRRAQDAVKVILTEGKGGHRLALDAALTATSSAIESNNSQKLNHALQLLKIVVAASPSLQTAQVDDLLATIFRAVRGTDQFIVLAAFSVLDSMPSGNSRAIKGFLDLAPAINDKQLAPAWLAGLAQQQPSILEVAGPVTTYLTSEFPEIVESSGQCLIALISDCLDPEDLGTLRKVASDYLFPLLQVRYHSAWATICEVCAAFIAVIPYDLAPKVEGVLNIVRVVGALRTTANEADQVLGAAISVLGPETVCELVPLQLDPNTGSGRAWMIPLLAANVVHTNISYYFQSLLPLANQFESIALELPESRRSKILQTIADQLFNLFPRFCNECQDVMVAEQVQVVLGWLYSKPGLRPAVCSGLKLFVETGANTEKFIQQFGTDVLKALLNVFQAMQVDSRGYVLDTVDAYLSVLPQNEVSQLFNQVSTMLAQSLGDADNRHTMMDITNAVVPYLDASTTDILFNLFKTVGSMNDALMQKKAYRALTKFEPGFDYQVLGSTLLEMQQSVLPNARRTRLQALELVGGAIPNDGDFSFVFRVLPEAILGTKDPNEKTRETAFNLLVLFGNRMHTATSGVVDHSKIPELANDNSKPPVSLTEYFEMIMAGLAGSTPHMVAATATSLARVLYEFHTELPEDKVRGYVELVWMLLESPNREIVTAALGFVKVSVLVISQEHLKDHLASLLSLLLAWSNEHKNHFRSKVRHLIERLIRRCGYEAVEQAFPESDMKLLHNIQKSKERARRKRANPSADDAQPTPSAHPVGRSRKYDNEFDEALYGSDSESEGEDEGAHQPPRTNQKQHSQRSGPRKEQYLVSGDEPLDLLDERVLSHISSTKPGKPTGDRSVKHKLAETKDGKLIIGPNLEAEREQATADALAAYVDAVKSGPIRTAQGKLKYKRGKKAQQQNNDDEDDAPTRPKLKDGKVGKKPALKKHMQRRRKL